jgi:predicted DCC family thiol-disulfide oxidoreductase YuxK
MAINEFHPANPITEANMQDLRIESVSKQPRSDHTARSSPGTAQQAPATFEDTEGPIVFFDGVCGLCNRFVDFLLSHDRNGVFRVAPLQGETALARLSEMDVRDLKTVVVIDPAGTHRKSQAIIVVLKGLGGFWGFVARILSLVPRPLRDWGYGIVARYRYRLFGRKPTCRIPSATERLRFLP